MMPKRILTIFFFLLSPLFILAQQPKLFVKGSGSNLYLEHDVVAGENFYSIGRLFNISPREIASYNSISMDKGLTVNQKLKIPLTADNFVQNTLKSAAEALVPLYHSVKSGETLYRVGLNNNNASLNDIKEWNNMRGDDVKQGSSLIVGFLRVSKTESAFAVQDFGGRSNAVATAPQNVAPKEEVKRNEKPKEVIEVTSKEESKNNDENVYPVTPTPMIKNEPATVTKAGYFKQEFEQVGAGASAGKVNGTASVFKSTSGWQDGKYYCFNNNAIPGSIVKISIKDSNEFIFAKVLDAIPDIKQNEGLTLVLSNAGADALGVNGDKFEATVQFYK